MNDTVKELKYIPIRQEPSQRCPGSAKTQHYRGSNRLERRPDKDVFTKERQTRPVKSAKPSRPVKSAKPARPILSEMTDEERIRYFKARRRQRALARKRRELMARAAVILTLLTGGGFAVAGITASGNYKTEDKTPPAYSVEAEPIESSAYFNYESPNVEVDRESPVQILVPEQDYIIEQEVPLTERVNEILENNPKIRSAFDDVEIALRRASIEYGGNIVELLQEKCDQYGGSMPVTIPICVLEHESGGCFTNWSTGDIKVAANGDTGWYQITPICEEDVNGRLNPDGRIRCKEDMTDNTEMGMIALGHKYTLYNGDIAKVLSAYNAGENFVGNGYIREKYVEGCNNNHLAPLSEYEEIWEYILSRDYYEFAEDGVPHVYVNPVDGSVRYPKN